jgi:hypothetical protein
MATGWLCAMLLRLDVGAEDGVHAGQVTLAASFEPFDYIGVETQMYAGFAAGHYDVCGFPEVRAE